jgi:hypothetical protein
VGDATYSWYLHRANKPTHTPKDPTPQIAQLNPKVPNPLHITNGKIKTQRMSSPLSFLFIASYLSFHSRLNEKRRSMSEVGYYFLCVIATVSIWRRAVCLEFAM